MASLTIELADGITGYLPGEQMRGEAAWSLTDAPRAVRVRLIWFTRGPAATQSSEADCLVIESPPARDRRAFTFTLPQGPYSFSGRIVSLAWAIEIVAEPSRQTERVEIVLSPTGMPVELHPPAA